VLGRVHWAPRGSGRLPGRIATVRVRMKLSISRADSYWDQLGQCKHARTALLINRLRYSGR
jgi:hypothetical protein